MKPHTIDTRIGFQNRNDSGSSDSIKRSPASLLLLVLSQHLLQTLLASAAVLVGIVVVGIGHVEVLVIILRGIKGARGNDLDFHISENLLHIFLGRLG